MSVVKEANEIGKPYGVKVIHQRGQSSYVMTYSFYRHDRWIGNTSLEHLVIPRMKLFAEAKK
jgi:hypothetical protein